ADLAPHSYPPLRPTAAGGTMGERPLGQCPAQLAAPADASAGALRYTDAANSLLRAFISSAVSSTTTTCSPRWVRMMSSHLLSTPLGPCKANCRGSIWSRLVMMALIIATAPPVGA